MTMQPPNPPDNVIVDLEPEALADLSEITNFYLTFADADFASAAYYGIRAQILDLAANSLLSGETIPGLDERYRLWYVLERRYKVYFERLGPTHINVLRVYGSRRVPLKPREIIRSLWRPVAPTTLIVPITPGTPPPLKAGRTRVQPKTMADLIGASPTTSVEYKLFKGMSAALLTKEIEARIEWLRTKARRLHSAEYKRLAIAYLQAELGKRRREE